MAQTFEDFHRLHGDERPLRDELEFTVHRDDGCALWGTGSGQGHKETRREEKERERRKEKDGKENTHSALSVLLVESSLGYYTVLRRSFLPLSRLFPSVSGPAACLSLLLPSFRSPSTEPPVHLHLRSLSPKLITHLLFSRSKQLVTLRLFYIDDPKMGVERIRE